MTTPRSVEPVSISSKTSVVTCKCHYLLSEDVLTLIVEKLVPTIGSKLENGTLLSRDLLALDARLDIASDVLPNEVLDGALVGNAREGEFGLGGQVLDDESGPSVTGQVEGFTVVDEFDGVDVNEVDLALELTSEGSKVFDELLEGIDVRRVDEEVGNGQTLLGV